MVCKGVVGECVQCTGTESQVLCKEKLVNVYKLQVPKDMWCVRGELVNVYSVLVRKYM